MYCRRLRVRSGVRTSSLLTKSCAKFPTIATFTPGAGAGCSTETQNYLLLASLLKNSSFGFELATEFVVYAFASIYLALNYGNSARWAHASSALPGRSVGNGKRHGQMVQPEERVRLHYHGGWPGRICALQRDIG